MLRKRRIKPVYPLPGPDGPMPVRWFEELGDLVRQVRGTVSFYASHPDPADLRTDAKFLIHKIRIALAHARARPDMVEALWNAMRIGQRFADLRHNVFYLDALNAYSRQRATGRGLDSEHSENCAPSRRSASPSKSSRRLTASESGGVDGRPPNEASRRRLPSSSIKRSRRHPRNRTRPKASAASSEPSTSSTKFRRAEKLGGGATVSPTACVQLLSRGHNVAKLPKPNEGAAPATLVMEGILEQSPAGEVDLTPKRRRQLTASTSKQKRPPPDLPDEWIVDPVELLERIPLDRSTIWRMVQEGRFPGADSVDTFRITNWLALERDPSMARRAGSRPRRNPHVLLDGRRSRTRAPNTREPGCSSRNRARSLRTGATVQKGPNDRVFQHTASVAVSRSAPEAPHPETAGPASSRPGYRRRPLRRPPPDFMSREIQLLLPFDPPERGDQQ